MEAMFLNPESFDLALDTIETFAKEIFSGKDEIQKLKLSQRLKNLLHLNDIEKSTELMQNLEVNAPRKVELPDEIWLKMIQNLPTKDLFANFSLSCKKFHNLSQDSSAVKYLHVKNINTWTKYCSVSYIIAKSRGLVQFRIIQGGGDFDNALICQALEFNPRLRNLSIKTKILNPETINTIIKSKVECLELDLEARGLDPRLCNIKTLKKLKMSPNNQIISTLAKNSTPIEEIYLLSDGQYLDNHAALNEFFKSKKETLKTLCLKLRRYDLFVPLKNLNLCQNLERVVIAKWHPKHLEMLTGIPNLKNLVLIELDAKVDALVAFFQRLSLKKLEYLSFQFCPNAKEEFFMELSKLDFPALKKLSFYQRWKDAQQSRSRNLTDNTLQNLVSNCPNLKQILFGDDFDNSNLSFKILMEIFQKRNIFILFGQSHIQFSMEQWFLNHDKNVYVKYQELKPIYM